MAEDADVIRGMQFARDLKEIRQANGISIDDIHNESKIPLGLIESFEENGLFDHTMFNRVYLRSFVRTYADVIGISPELALSSLEAALDGTYDRELAVEYLDYEPPSEPELEDDVIPEPDVPLEAEEVQHAESPRQPPLRLNEPAAPPVEPPKREPLPAEPVVPVYTPAWTSQSPPPGTRVEPRRPDRGGSGKLALVVVALVVVAAVVWGLTRFLSGGDAATVEPATVVSDTSSVEGEAIAPEPAPQLTLGDSMRVTIASADSQLVQGIRVTVDDDVRRPYWLERGESRTFLVRNRIAIEEQLNRIALSVEGRAYPTNRLDDQGRIVITRDTALQLLSQPQ